MNAKHLPPPTPTTLSEAFWPLFMTNKVMVRFVGAYICFGVADDSNRLLVVYAHDTASRLHLPTQEAIARAFPLRNAKQQEYTGPHDLPVSYSDIQRVRNVMRYEFLQENRRVLLLVSTPEESVVENQEQLMFIQWSRPNPLQIARIVETIGADRVHVVRKNALETRLLVELKPNERLKFSVTGCHFSSPFATAALLPVQCDTCTA
ncbi:MAG: hypothetical protein UT32_C0009G0049 [Parcubacteria group bacterium GW2011_GWC2_39_14]|nr:MAG: hypothetical protein UT32_C0009G0049 [Parcubacteria group bacterium GW2011_GWC2_39_14]KKR55387.1 MAG: hypothetical protein UT91_C0002G0048 [Parcubacteria group bacterium GW2011_GWA2_40_23]